METLGVITAVAFGIMFAGVSAYCYYKRNQKTMKKNSSTDNFEDILEHSIP
jgi:O-antigen/teichoic acid export membrane protein